MGRLSRRLDELLGTQNSILLQPRRWVLAEERGSGPDLKQTARDIRSRIQEPQTLKVAGLRGEQEANEAHRILRQVKKCGEAANVHSSQFEGGEHKQAALQITRQEPK